MADTVQTLMERMVPELQDLLDKGIFNDEEVRAIVQRRRNYEYVLKRRDPARSDFFRYLEYEKQVEKLRKLRKSRLTIKKMGLSDSRPIQRIYYIYDRLLRRFQGDVAIWCEYLEFAIANKSTKVISKTFPKALQLHPLDAGLWIKAAAWELEDNGNISAARMMLQRGIRTIPGSSKLWHEYVQCVCVGGCVICVRVCVCVCVAAFVAHAYAVWKGASAVCTVGISSLLQVVCVNHDVVCLCVNQ